MTSDVQLMMSMKITLNREVSGWPNAVQGEDSVLLTQAGVDIETWNDAYIAKLTIAGGADVTVDLQNWTDLLFEAGKAFDEVFAIALVVEPSVEADDDIMLEVSPGAVDPLQWFFRADDEGIRLADGETMMLSKRPTAAVGFPVDAANKTLLFANSGTDSLVATVIVVGGIDA